MTDGKLIRMTPNQLTSRPKAFAFAHWIASRRLRLPLNLHSSALGSCGGNTQ